MMGAWLHRLLYTQQSSQGVEKAEAGLTWTWGFKGQM